MDLAGETTAQVNEDGTVVIQVPNKRIARLVSLGIHQEVAQKRRSERRKAAKQSRKRNRKR